MTATLPRLEAPCSAYEFLTVHLPKAIREEPGRMWMGLWINKTDFGRQLENMASCIGIEVYADGDLSPGDRAMLLERTPSCGTIGCIGGWTETMVDNRASAIDILALSHLQTVELFYPHDLTNDPDQGTAPHVERVVAHLLAFAEKYEDQMRAVTVVPRLRP